MPPVIVNWKTTLWGLSPLVFYALDHYGFWPAWIPLPPLKDAWPFIMSAAGIGWVAKDNNVTGGTKEQ